jgi:hypothetical protein
VQTSPLGIVGAAAATSLALRQNETDRAAQEGANHARQAAADRSAESAAGIGETEQDEAASDRDADGRRLWEAAPNREESPEAENDAAAQAAKDPTGQSGTQLDLSG